MSAIEEFEPILGARRAVVSLDCPTTPDSLGDKLRQVENERECLAGQLRERDADFTSLLEHSPDIIFRLDRQLRHRYISNACERLFDIPAQSFIGKTGREAGLSVQQSDQFEQLCRESLRTGRESRYETRVGGRCFHTRLIPEPDGRGGFGSLMGITQDVTAQWRVEEERATLLAQTQAARSEAEIANRMKDEFLSRVSHELSTPLAAMRMWVHVLRGNQARDRESAVAAIEQCTAMQARLIEDLLDASRVLRGELRLSLEPCEPVPPLERALTEAAPHAKARSIELSASFADALPLVLADEGRLRQIAAHLLSNAIKFSPPGTTVRLSLDPQRQGNRGGLALTVTDQGRGFAPSLSSSLFSPFLQADGSSTRRDGGLGLGLTIVRELVQLHGGTVSAHSDGVGKGASFRVWIPEMENDGRDDHDDGDRHSQERVPGVAGLSVLVVEDDDLTRRGITRVLEQAGARVTAASGAQEGFEALHRTVPDVLVCDISMPHENGYSLIGRIRSLPGPQARVPAIALTAHTRPEDRALALKAGFDAHIGKPVEPAVLGTIIAGLAHPRS